MCRLFSLWKWVTATSSYKTEKAGNNVQQVCWCLSIAENAFYYSKPKFIDAQKIMLEMAMRPLHGGTDVIYCTLGMLIVLQAMEG